MPEDNKKCEYCGSELKEGMDFCSACGHDLSKKNDKSKVPPKGFRYDYLYILVFIVVFAAAFFVIHGSRGVSTRSAQESISQSAGMATIDDMLASLPDDYNELVKLGNKFMDNRHYAVAVECYRRALAINSSDPNVICDLGACLHATGDFGGAAKMFEKAIDIDSLHAIAYFNLGIVFRTMQENDSAKIYWEKLISLFPNQDISDSARKYLEQINP
jgi:tetratricopeptide (TPR) repeat protein